MTLHQKVEGSLIFIYSYIQVNGVKFSIKGQIELVKFLQNGQIATQGL